MRSSSGCEVVAALPDAGLRPVPVAVLERSRTPLFASPTNSAAVTARATTDGWATVTVPPTGIATMLCAARTTVRTPFVLFTSASTE